MRTTLAVIGATALAGVLGYHFAKVERRPKPPGVQEIVAAAGPNDKQVQDSVIARLLRTTPSDSSAARQAEVDEKLSELDARMRGVESANQDPEDAASSARQVPDEATEADLALWMDEALRSEDWDKNATNLTTADIEKNLALSPEIKLDELDCNRRVCRAAFSQENGERPAASTLFGLMPFTHEGFTIEEPDGRVKVYFTRSGQTLNGLRGEALAALR